jgi:hypothetical protein
MERLVYRGETCDKVLFESTDGAFSGVAAMALRRHQLLLHIIGGEKSFKAADASFVNTLGKAGAQKPHLPLGDDSSPWGDNSVCR